MATEPRMNHTLADWCDYTMGVFTDRRRRLRFPGFRKHMLEAQKQQLLAVKSLIDDTTEWIDNEINHLVTEIDERKTQKPAAKKSA